MISFDIDLSVPKIHQWSWDGQQWVSPAGWVRPFPHPQLDAVCAQDGPHVSFTVRESAQHGDFIRLDLTKTTAKLEAGMLGRAPIYLRHRDRRLSGSWQITDLMADRLPFGALVDRAVARLLTRQPRYTSDTLFPDIICLTERATAMAGAAGLELAYPEPVRSPGPAPTNGDPTGAFASIVFAHLSGRGTDATDLSGGVDSAVVAYDVTQASNNPVASFGLIVPGRHREAQRARRRAMANAFGLTDTEIFAANHLPFGPGHRQRLHDPASSDDREAFDALAQRAAEAGAYSLAIGIGGESLTTTTVTGTGSAVHGRPRTPRWLGGKACSALDQIGDNAAPAGHLTAQTLLALSSRTPGILAAGLWPVAPLADPHLLRLCRVLPSEWMAGKRLLRERLASGGLDPAVAGATSPDSFEQVSRLGLHRYGLPLLARFLTEGLLLSDLGYIEPLKLQETVNAARRTNVIDPRLAEVVRLELGLRRIWGEA